jgi:drug/metabolite transporter (DMT)-like permease
MTMTNSIPCPHCGDQNSSGGAFCQSCGKALPSAIPQGPRVVGGKEFASTSAGQKLQAEELHKQASRASRTFLYIGTILTILGIFFLYVSMSVPPGRQVQSPYIYWVYLFGGVLFLGVGFWARINPLPATIVGFVAYLAATGFYILRDVQTGHTEVIGQTLIIRLIVAFALLKAVGAGIRYRKLMEAQSSNIPMAGRVE